MFDPIILRRQFPILSQKIGKQPLVYLDSAATAQKPKAVLEVMDTFYREQNGNAHRGMHVLAERATEVLEGARKTVAQLLSASPEEIVFTRNATEGINLVARSWGSRLERGNGIAVSLLEHHSNIVSWLQLKEERGLELDWIEIDDAGAIDLEGLRRTLAAGSIKLVAITGLSNVLGVRPPVEDIIDLAHEAGAKVLVDAAQLIAHEAVDVQKMNCDFLVFSGHKVFGSLGIGVLYGKQEILRTMPPFLGGGQMIQQVTQQGFLPADIPHRFEAGTQPIAEAAGLAAALTWLQSLDRKAVGNHERALLDRAIEGMKEIPGLTLLGDPEHAVGCISFVIERVHPHDLTEIIGRQGICLRAGHHCAQPLHDRLGIKASTRLSVAPYNTEKEIDAALDAIVKASEKLRT